MFLRLDHRLGHQSIEQYLLHVYLTTGIFHRLFDSVHVYI